MPTETVYGLGANACSEEAVRKIFSAKGRPSDNPLIVHVAELGDAKNLVFMDKISEKLAQSFWPGPLTLVLPVDLQSPQKMAVSVTAGLPSVGIRIPKHPLALELLREAGVPVAAPSANKSGSPSPTTAQHVIDDYIGCANGPAMVLDGGPCQIGLESTVLKVVGSVVTILRPGAIGEKDIRECLRNEHPEVTVKFVGNNGLSAEAPEAPGMKYRHYAPKANVVAVSDWSKDGLIQENDLLLIFDSSLRGAEQAATIKHRVTVKSLGSDPTDFHTASSRLFDLLRFSDKINPDRVLVDCTFDVTQDIGVALWNRISKAASKV